MNKAFQDLCNNIQQIILQLIMMLSLQFCSKLSEGDITLDLLYITCNAVSVLLIFYSITSFFGKRLKTVLRNTFFFSLLLDFLLNLGCYIATGSVFGIDHLGMVFGTNINEASEFFTAYFSIFDLLIIPLIIIVVVFFFFNHLFKVKNNTVFKLLLSSSTILCLGIALFHINIISIFPFRPYFLLRLYEPTPNLREYSHSLKIKYESDSLPENIVLIIGESFAKYHSSLYGYEKQTNPFLEDLVKNEKLIVYSDVVSSEVSTIPSFKTIFSTYSRQSSQKWYECVTLFDVIKPKYKTFWCSNQTSDSFFDNLLSCYVELSDSVWFTPKTEDKTYDEVIIPKLRELVQDSTEKKFIIINLMGQHPDYEQRYPMAFNNFQERDYSDKPEHQRKVFAFYDNATIYNDYVVSELFKSIDTINAVGIYFPDHGQDIFISDSDYAGHAHKNWPPSYNAGIQIPFIVYTNEIIKKNYSNAFSKILRSKDKSLCTDSFIDYLCYILGISYKEE